MTTPRSPTSCSCISDLDGSVNFIAGASTYNNLTTWSVPLWNYGSSFRFQNADEAAVAASPIFGFVPVSNCQDVLTNVIEGFGIGVSRGGRDVAQGWDCPQGNDHTHNFLFSTNGGSTTNAFFVNAEYQVNEQWQVSGGLRYTEDEKEQLFDGGWIIFPIGGVPLILYFDDSDLKKRTWGRTIGHVSLEYAPAPDQLIYRASAPPVTAQADSTRFSRAHQPIRSRRRPSSTTKSA